MLGFKLAVQNGLTVYNLKDGIVDEFASTAGVGTSPGGTYNPSSSPGANNDIPNELIEPALTPVTTS